MNFMVKVLTDTRTVIAAITVAVGLYVDSKIDSVTEMLVAANATLQTIQQLIDVDPTKITDVSETLNVGAQTVGEGIGEGGADVVNRVGEVWNNFRNPVSE